MRKVQFITETRRIDRNGKMYEFGREFEPSFTSRSGKVHPPLITLWARVHNGYGWMTIHYMVLEG